MDEAKAADLSAAIKAIRDRVSARYPIAPAGKTNLVLVDLAPVHKSRDTAETKVAAIGSVNPRPPGLVNNLIQWTKRLTARSLNWLFRDQIEFNRASTNSTQAVLDALNDFNRLAVDLSTRIDHFTSRIEACELQANQNADIESHWLQWRREWEHKLATNEVQFLRGVADLQAAFQQRTAQMDAAIREQEHRLASTEPRFLRAVADLEAVFQQRTVQMDAAMREQVRAQHTDFEGALAKSATDVQKRLWDDLRQARLDMERLIHVELRAVRQRMTPVALPGSESAPPMTSVPTAMIAADPTDPIAFANRFRGPEDYVRGSFREYVDAFREAKLVLDIGCGRGEFLELMREAGVNAIGVDGSKQAVAQCRSKGLNVTEADLFEYLAAAETPFFDGIFCAQVVEHLPPELLPGLIRLIVEKLNPSGVVMIETPNPECLAIFATHFYIDPTHTRPVPAQLLRFYFEEAGLTEIQVKYRQTDIPEVQGLPEEVRKKFFNGYDYVISARRP